MARGQEGTTNAGRRGGSLGLTTVRGSRRRPMLRRAGGSKHRRAAARTTEVRQRPCESRQLGRRSGHGVRVQRSAGLSLYMLAGD